MVTSIAPVETSLPQMGKKTLTITDILGVAIFDINGLPREYFITEENPSTSWVQIVFQALGLRALLASSLGLEGFQQITIHLKETTAIVVRRRQDYLALQFKGKLPLDSKDDNQRLTTIVNAFDAEKLKQHPHFKVS